MFESSESKALSKLSCKNNFFNNLRNLNNQLKVKSKIMTDALDKYFGNSVDFKIPIGGIYIWITFPNNVDTTILYNNAIRAGIAINPGEEWSKNINNQKKMRLCFANPSKGEIEEGIKLLAEICQKQFGVPANIANIN